MDALQRDLQGRARARAEASGRGLSARSTTRDTVAAGLLAAIVIVLYSGVLTAGFVSYDDHTFVAGNPHVQAGVTRDSLWWAATSTETVNWQPLTWLSYLVVVDVFDGGPEAQHLVNILLHAGNGALLLLALRRLGIPLVGAACTATFFAIHPLRVESVAWIAERKDVLCGLFFCLGLWAWARYAASPSRGRYVLVVLTHACALMSKPMAVTFPCVWLLVDVWPLGRHSQTPWRRLCMEKLPLLVLSGMTSMVTLVAQQPAMRELAALPLDTRAANFVVAVGHYLQKTVWPTGLAVLYPLPIPGPSATAVLLSLLVAAAITAVAITRARCRQPDLLVGWLWTLGMLVPVGGLVQVGEQAYADRYTYLPMIGVALAAFHVCSTTVQAWPLGAQRSAMGAFALLCGGLGLATVEQLTHWQDSESLWRHTVAVTKDNARALQAYGNALLVKGDVQGAERMVREAVRVSPTLERRALLGRTLVHLGRAEEARALLADVMAEDPSQSQAAVALAKALNALGDRASAVALLQRRAHLHTRDMEFHLVLGTLLDDAGDHDAGVAALSAALELRLNDPRAAYELGRRLTRRGRAAEAAMLLEQTHNAHPLNLDLMDALVRALAEAGRGEDAQDVRRGCLRQAASLHAAAPCGEDR